MERRFKKLRLVELASPSHPSSSTSHTTISSSPSHLAAEYYSPIAEEAELQASIAASSASVDINIPEPSVPFQTSASPSQNLLGLDFHPNASDDDDGSPRISYYIGMIDGDMAGLWLPVEIWDDEGSENDFSDGHLIASLWPDTPPRRSSPFSTLPVDVLNALDASPSTTLAMDEEDEQHAILDDVSPPGSPDFGQ